MGPKPADRLLDRGVERGRRQAQLAPRLRIVEEVRVRRVARRLERRQRPLAASRAATFSIIHPTDSATRDRDAPVGDLDAGDARDRLVEVAQHDVVVAEDVALADAPLLGGEHVPLGAVVDVDGAEAGVDVARHLLL